VFGGDHVDGVGSPEPVVDVDVAAAGGVGDGGVRVAEQDVLHGGVDGACAGAPPWPRSFGGGEGADDVAALAEEEHLEFRPNRVVEVGCYLLLEPLAPWDGPGNRAPWRRVAPHGRSVRKARRSSSMARARTVLRARRRGGGVRLHAARSTMAPSPAAWARAPRTNSISCMSIQRTTSAIVAPEVAAAYRWGARAIWAVLPVVRFGNRGSFGSEARTATAACGCAPAQVVQPGRGLHRAPGTMWSGRVVDPDRAEPAATGEVAASRSLLTEGGDDGAVPFQQGWYGRTRRSLPHPRWTNDGQAGSCLRGDEPGRDMAEG